MCILSKSKKTLDFLGEFRVYGMESWNGRFKGDGFVICTTPILKQQPLFLPPFRLGCVCVNIFKWQNFILEKLVAFGPGSPHLSR